MSNKVWTPEELGVDTSDLDLDDLGDFYRAWDRCKKAKKERNREFSTELLRRKGVTFDVKNMGWHLIVHWRDSIVDFWPSTGKWIVRDGRKGRGVRNLFKELGIP